MIRRPFRHVSAISKGANVTTEITRFLCSNLGILCSRCSFSDQISGHARPMGTPCLQRQLDLPVQSARNISIFLFTSYSTRWRCFLVYLVVAISHRFVLCIRRYQIWYGYTPWVTLESIKKYCNRIFSKLSVILRNVIG